MRELAYDGKTGMWSEMPDEALARHAAAGSLDDFEGLLRRYRKRVYCLCYRMAGNADDAEDWTQECFLRVYRQLARYNPKMPFAPWLLRVVSNSCVNLAKARHAQRGKLEAGFEDRQELAGAAPDPVQVALRTDEARQIQAAVARPRAPIASGHRAADRGGAFVS